jgi:hypothetical protein
LTTNEITLDKKRIHKIVKVTVESTKKVKDLEAIEAIIGFAEALGRIIAAQNMGEAGHQELIRVAGIHVIDTVKSAYDAAGKPSSAFTIN